MISMNALGGATPLVKALDAKKLGVVAIADTPMSQLIEAAKTGLCFQPSQENNDSPAVDFDCLVNAIHYSSTSGDVGGVVPHSLIVDELVDFLAPHVANHIAYAKNVVNPKIMEAAKRISDDLASAPSYLSTFKITTYNVPALFTNRLVEGAVEEYSGALYNPNFKLPFSFNDLSYEEIIKLMMTESNSLDKDIALWAAAQKPADIEALFTSIFGLKNQDYLLGNVIKSYSTFGNGWSNDIDKLLFIYFVAKKLIDNPVDYIKVGTSAYSSKMSELIQSVGNRLYVEYINYYKAIENNKILVRSIEGTEVIVYDSPYKHFIANGGSTEALMGLVFLKKANGPLTSFPYLTEDVLFRKVELEALYNKQVAIISLTETNNKFTTSKSILKSTLYKLIREEFAEDPTIPAQEFIDRVGDVVETIKRDEFDNIPKLAMKVVCRTRYYKCAAEDILESINRISKENPNISIRDVSSIAAIEYIADYLFDQLKIV